MTLAVLHLHSPVERLVSAPATHISTDCTLLGAAQVMRLSGVSAVLVGLGPDAIVTEHDLAGAIAEGLPLESPAAMVATRHPVVLGADTEILDAASVMLNRHFRHLVVELRSGDWAILPLDAVAAVLLQAARPDFWLSSLRVKVEVTDPEVWPDQPTAS